VEVVAELADETVLVIGVSHYPPGTSRWIKIEHGLFSEAPASAAVDPCWRCGLRAHAADDVAWISGNDTLS
jgi:hypothetical protein